MRQSVVFTAIIIIGAGIASCGGDSLSATPTPSGGGPATFPATSEAESPTTVTQTPSPAAPTVQDLTTVAEAMFPRYQSSRYETYGSCDGGKYDSCPITSRLKAWLLQVDAASERNFSAICRCQNYSNTRDIVATPNDTGGIATVSLFSQDRKLELVIVRENGQLLVDDTRCAGYPQTSLYSDDWACPSPPVAAAALAAAVKVVKGVAADPDCPSSGGQWCVKPDPAHELSVVHGLAVFGIRRADTGEAAHLVMGEDLRGSWDYWLSTQQDLEPFSLPGDMIVCTGGSGLNVRSKPSTGASVVGTLADTTISHGVRFRLTSPGTFDGAPGEGWYQISAPLAGWVSSGFVFAVDARTNGCSGLPPGRAP